MTKRSLPYKVDQEYDIINILKERHEIPYHSRSFMWTETQYISHVTNDIIQEYRNNNPYWLGIVILYTGGNIPSVSDAQHRLTICFLMILAISNILDNPEPLKWISKYGDDSLLNIDATEEDNEVLEKYGWTRYPNIVSCYDYDFEALGNLLNSKEKPPILDSKIYSAYDVIYNIIKKEVESQEDWVSDCKLLLKYINRDIRVLRISISDWHFAMTVFNSFNNIKVAVPPSYLLRNAFAYAIGESRSSEIHELFSEIEKMDRRNYEKNVHMFVNLYAKRILIENDYQDIKNIVSEGESAPLAKFQKIFHQAQYIFKFLKENPYGKILHVLSSGHEIVSLCLLPFGYCMLNTNQPKIFEKQFEKLLKLLICYGIRKGKVCFNSLSFQTPLMALVKQLLRGEISHEVGMKKLVELLKEWLGNHLDSGKFIQFLANESFKGAIFNRRARPIMLFLIEMTDRLETSLIHDATDIDHIYPKKPSSTIPPLENMELRHNIGNFTPFVSKNIDDVRGNKSLGNRAFKNKVEFYKKSNIAMTRKVAEKYEASDFRDEQIIERANEIAKLFDQITLREFELV